MKAYITELKDYFIMLIEEYNRDYLENLDFYKRNNITMLDNKILQSVSNILKKIHIIEKNNNLFNNIKFNEFICFVMFSFKEIDTKNTIDIFKRYGFALRKIYIKTHNLNDDLILF